jgi:hypothetical protein
MGGRFGEIAGGAPSVHAVVQNLANASCGETETHAIFAQYLRWDYYASNLGNKELCNLPESGSIWYFSFINIKDSGYFNSYDNCCGGLVITMAYNSRDVSKLPIKGSTALNNMLKEMTSIVRTLEVKGIPLTSLTRQCESN